MTEEELFCKLFPEYAVNGKPLSPYFDLFESGYEQAENLITEQKLKLEALEGQTPWKDIKDKGEIIGKLTKAKEIIKILLKYDRGQFFDNRRIYEKYMQTRSEAEQFLKDSEKEC